MDFVLLLVFLANWAFRAVLKITAILLKSKYLNFEGGSVFFRGENKYKLYFLYIALDS